MIGKEHEIIISEHDDEGSPVAIVGGSLTSLRAIMLALQTEGEEAKWLSIVLPLRSNWLLRSVMAASFAAPLVSKLHYRNIVLHVYGLNPAEENALLTLAMSLWGGSLSYPEIHNYSEGWNKLKKAATEAPKYLPLEIGSDPASTGCTQKVRNTTPEGHTSKARKATEGQKGCERCENRNTYIRNRGDIVYALASAGVPWRTAIISTGRKPITYPGCLTGLYTRTIELAPEADTDRADLARLVERTEILQSSYRYAGEAFIDFIEEELDDATLKADHKRMMQELKVSTMKDGVNEVGDPDHKRSEVAVIALADYYSSIAVYGWGCGLYNDERDCRDRRNRRELKIVWDEAVELGRQILNRAVPHVLRNS